MKTKNLLVLILVLGLSFNAFSQEKITIKQTIKSSDFDLGSREKLAEADRLIWYPAEVNTSIRPGWFYHPNEDHETTHIPLYQLNCLASG